MLIALPIVSDPISSPYSDLFFPKPDYRLVQFVPIIENHGDDRVRLEDRDFRLKDTDGDWHRPFFFLIGGRTRAVLVGESEGAPVELIFEIPTDVDPSELHIDLGPSVLRTLVYDFD